jgi:DNA-binding XRE family transcriptional regulator
MMLRRMTPRRQQRVRAARLLHSVSQTSLAKSVSLSQGAISQIESGRLVTRAIRSA